MTSPTSAGPSATPAAPAALTNRPLHWSVAAPLSAVAGVGAAVLGVLADVPLLGVAGAVVAAVPALLAARRVPVLRTQAVRARSRAEATERALHAAEASLARSERTLARADAALALADRALAARGGEQAAPPVQEPRLTVDLVQAHHPRRGPVAHPAAGEPSVPEQQPAPQLVHHASGAATGTGAAPAAAPAAAARIDARVDTAELQLIWDLGEAPRSRTGRGRRSRVGAEVDALPDRPRHPAGSRRRARHRA